MSELGILILIDSDRHIAIIPITIISMILFFISAYKLGQYFRNYESNMANFLILAIHFFICLIFILRTLWGVFMLYSLGTSANAIDSLSCIILTFIGNLFTLLWLGLYFSNDSIHDEVRKSICFNIVAIILILLTLLDLAMHLYLVFLSQYNYNERLFGIILANNIVAFITSAFLVGCVINTSRQAKVIYSGNVGRKVSHRMIFISIILTLAYELKALSPLVVQKFVSGKISNELPLLYYILFELVPIIAVLLILKVENEQEDYLPSSLVDENPLLETKD
ncbi:hypothetical protein SteCoe_18656 [Stentor coeruleus]|uniref:Uncharacterized protein n=1 Tax=Stentor coeruleus TaxID=5963 RepID=A0A1R2BW02_9CILI|nr:hypothetical protein SteCoe_18656 [Stentor coeruleus]